MILVAGGCSLSFEVGPTADAGPDVAPSYDSGVPDQGNVGTDAGTSDTGTSDTGTSGPPSPPQYIDNETASPSGTTTLTVSRPSGTQAGDLLLVSVFANNATNTISPEPGWTELDKMPAANCESVALWAYRIMGPSEPSLYTFTTAQAANRAAIAIIAYRGIDANAPLGSPGKRIDVKGNADAYGPLSVTTDQPNARIVMMPVNDQGGTTANWSAPTGMVKRADSGRLAFFDEVRANAGPSDARTATTSATDHCGAVEMVFLRPARR